MLKKILPPALLRVAGAILGAIFGNMIPEKGHKALIKGTANIPHIYIYVYTLEVKICTTLGAVMIIKPETKLKC